MFFRRVAASSNDEEKRKEQPFAVERSVTPFGVPIFTALGGSPFQASGFTGGHD